MREIRIIAVVVLAATVCVVCWFAWVLVHGRSGGMDVQAVRRIERQCGYQTACKVQLGDLFEGNWDTFYEFGVGVSQAELNATLGDTNIRVEPMTRTLVLTRNGRVVDQVAERYDPQQALDGEIVVVDPRGPGGRIIRLDRKTWLRVLAFPVDDGVRRGTEYQLSTDVQ